MDRAPRRSLLSLPGALRYRLLGFGLASALGCSSAGAPADAGRTDRAAIIDSGRDDVRRDAAADSSDAPQDAPLDLADLADVADLAVDGGSSTCDGAMSDRTPLDQNISDGLPADRARYHQCVPEKGSGVERCDPYIVQEPESCPPGCRACNELVSALDCFSTAGSGGGTRTTCTPSQVCEDEPDPPCCVCLH
jgi:hypothetical protein